MRTKENFTPKAVPLTPTNNVGPRLDRSKLKQVMDKQIALTEKFDQRYESFSTLLASYLKTEVSDTERLETMNRFEAMFDKMLEEQNNRSFQEKLGLGNSSLRNDALIIKAHSELIYGDQLRLIALYSIVRNGASDPALTLACNKELVNTDLPALLDQFDILFQ